jgi:hypothetical protein
VDIGASVDDVIVGEDMPAALITKPVPVLPTLFSVFFSLFLAVLGEAGAPLPASPVATGFAASFAKSPALFSPSALTLVTQVAMTLSSGPVEVKLNCSVACPAWATIRLARWNVRAAFTGRIAVSVLLELAVANSLAWDWPSNVTSIGAVSPLFSLKAGLAKPSSQALAAFCPTTRLTPLA